MTQAVYVNQQPAVYYNPKQENVSGAGATAAGVAASIGALCSADPITLTVVMPMLKKNGKLPADKIEIFHKAAEKALKEAKVEEKGVHIVWLPKRSESSIARTFEELFNNMNGQRMYGQGGAMVEMVREGKNAFFLMGDLPGTPYKKNTILMPEKELNPQVFHEIGHSINNNISKFGSTLQKLRGFSIFAPLALGLYGLCTRNSKPDDNEELSGLQKTNNFVRNNIGKLAFAATLPMLIEEGMASIRGEKLARKVLDKSLMKYVTKGNWIGYTSYLLTATAFSLSAYAGVKVKDKILAKKEAQQKAENEAMIAYLEQRRA